MSIYICMYIYTYRCVYTHMTLAVTNSSFLPIYSLSFNEADIDGVSLFFSAFPCKIVIIKQPKVVNSQS